MTSRPKNDEFNLWERSEESLKQRLHSGIDLSADECEKIAHLEHRLVPTAGALDEKSNERLRALARLSQTDFKPPRTISSHRPLVGPVIVRIKKALWPLINALLKDTFKAQKEFNELMLEEYLHSLGRK